jgi:hypothetical protein
MARIKIISPTKTQLVNGEGLLLPVRFEYRKSVYETYEPYFIVRMMAKRKGISIRKLLLSELSRGRNSQSLRKNAK